MSIHAISCAKKQKTGSPTLKAILVSVAYYANENGVCWPPQERISSDTEYNSRTILRALAELERLGFLMRRKRAPTANGARQTDVIAMNIHGSRADRTLMERTVTGDMTKTPKRNPKLDAKRRRAEARKIIRATPGYTVKTPASAEGTPSKESKKAFYCSWEWRTLRMEIIKQHGPVCSCCHARSGETDAAGNVLRIEVDHIKPLHTHWHMRLDRNNLQILCSACNQGKGAWDQTDWRQSNPIVAEIVDPEFSVVWGETWSD